MNGKPVALLGDETEADGKVSSAASTIKIDEGKPFVFIGPNVHIGKNVSFSVKKPADNKTPNLLEDIIGILIGAVEDVAGVPADETGVGEVIQVDGTVRIIRDYQSAKEIIKDAVKDKPKIFRKSGGFEQANSDFNKIAGNNLIKQHEGNIRSTVLSDGTSISVRPTSSGGLPTVQINPASGKPIKVRYVD